MSATLSRRDWLTAAGGVLVGAAATEVGNLLTPDSMPSPKKIASPGEELMVEHGVLNRVLLAYREISTQLQAGIIVPAEVITDSAQIILDFVESFHEGLEEAYVFPRVRSGKPDLVTTLLTQHDRGRHLTASIITASTENVSLPPIRDGLVNAMNKFVRMYEPHEAWEDTVIFPALRKSSSPKTLDLLAERFADLENKQFGDDALRKMLQRISGIEAQLGIGDLAKFTP
ncbi:MAG: hemerythrin domain-containing protein [Antricoccus sp.]